MSRNKTALVIGGGKFLGRAVVERLLSDGIETSMLTRGLEPNPSEGRVEWLKCDRDDQKTFDELLGKRDFDYVVDIISYTPWHAKHAAEFFLGRTSRFIHISTAAVYLLDKHTPLPFKEEESPDCKDKSIAKKSPLLAYAIDKRDAEIEMENAIGEKGFPAVILRPPVICGIHDYTQRDFGYIQRVQDDGPVLSSIERMASFRHVFVDDVVEAVMLSLDNRDAVGETFNIASYSILSLKEYLSILGRAFDKEVEIRYLSHKILKENLGSIYCPFAYPRDFIQDLFKARHILGFKPSRSEKWLADLAHYFANDYKGDPPKDYKSHRNKEMELMKDLEGEKV